MLGWGPEGPRSQERGAQRGAEAPAEMQRRTGSPGHGALLLVALLILTDGRQLLHQAAVALPVLVTNSTVRVSEPDQNSPPNIIINNNNSLKNFE